MLWEPSQSEGSHNITCLATAIPAVILAGYIMFVLGGLLGTGLFGTGVTGILDKQATIKAKVFEQGWEHFLESLDKTADNIYEIINVEFRERFMQVDDVISETISLYENLLEQQESGNFLPRNQRVLQSKFWR